MCVALKTLQHIESKWRVFLYNLRWSNWISYIDGWIPRFALFVPLLGYLILFNDEMSQMFSFRTITNEIVSFGLNGSERLRFLYFGLIFLGLSNFIYRVRKPYAFRIGTNQVDYTRTALEVFDLDDFLDMHQTIREGHLTLKGKYYDSEWDQFWVAARGESDGSVNGNWDSAQKAFGSLLRAILSETFFRADTSRRVWLWTCIILSTIGYLFLALPSLDLFFKVCLATVAA